MINNISSFNDNDKMIMIKGLNDVLERMIEIIYTLIEWWSFVLFNDPRYK